MYRLSEFIGKETIVLSSGESGGTISNAFFDVRLKLLKFAELIDNESEHRKMVAFRSIMNSNGEAVVIRSNANFVDAIYEGLVPAPMNLTCFNQDGKSLGVVRDIIMEGNKIIKYVSDTMSIEANTLLVASLDLLIFNDTGQAIKKPPNKKIERIRNSNKYTNKRIAHSKQHARIQNIMNDEVDLDIENDDNWDYDSNTVVDEFYQTHTTNDIAPIKTPEKITEDNTAVYRSPIKNDCKTKFKFLLGAYLMKDIYNNNGELILKKGTSITESEIYTAKQNDRLVSMTLNCL